MTSFDTESSGLHFTMWMNIYILYSMNIINTADKACTPFIGIYSWIWLGWHRLILRALGYILQCEWISIYCIVWILSIQLTRPVPLLLAFTAELVRMTSFDTESSGLHFTMWMNIYILYSMNIINTADKACTPFIGIYSWIWLGWHRLILRALGYILQCECISIYCIVWIFSIQLTGPVPFSLAFTAESG